MVLSAGPGWTAEPAPPEAGLPRENPEEPIEVVPLVPWAQTFPVASLNAPQGGSPPPAAQGNRILDNLQVSAGKRCGFKVLPLATGEQAAAFEAAHGTQIRAAVRSADSADDIALAGKLRDEAEPLERDSGLRRLLLSHCLALLMDLPGNDQAVGECAGWLSVMLEGRTPAELTAAVHIAEGLLARAARGSDPELLQQRRKDLCEKLIALFRFQVRHGYLDEAREALARLKRDGAEPADLQPLRLLLDERTALRDRFRRFLREVEAKASTGAQWRSFALFILAGLRDEPLAAAAAVKADHPALAECIAVGTGSGRKILDRTEKLVGFIPLADPADRPGLVAIIFRRLRDLEARSPGIEPERIQALRVRAETLMASKEKPSTATAVYVKVPANRAWIPSGVFVKKGSRYRLSAEGTWSLGGKGAPAGMDAAGDPAAKAALGGYPPGALVAQIGASTETILIGRQLVFASPLDGEIFLSINDEFREFADNSGELVVRLEMPAGPALVQPKPAPGFAGRWSNAAGGRTSREILPDGTCRTGPLRGTWIAWGPKEAVLRWENGAIERMTLNQSDAASLTGHGGRLFHLVREEAVEKDGLPPIPK